MNPLTHNESSALIWAFVGLVAILIAIGWYYIQSSIRSQKEMSNNLFAIRINQAEHNKDLESLKEDMQEVKDDVQGIKEDVLIMNHRQNQFDKELIYLKGKK